MKPYVDKVTGELYGFFSEGNSSIPKTAIEAEGVPKDGRDSYDLVRRQWKDYEPGYVEKRLIEYQQIELGDQLDAIAKGLDIVIPALIEGRKLTAEEAALLTPDKTKPVDTPAGWRGKVKEIKERNPKP